MQISNIWKKEKIPNTFYISMVTSGHVRDSLAPSLKSLFDLIALIPVYFIIRNLKFIFWDNDFLNEFSSRSISYDMHHIADSFIGKFVATYIMFCTTVQSINYGELTICAELFGTNIHHPHPAEHNLDHPKSYRESWKVRNELHICNNQFKRQRTKTFHRSFW